SLPSDGHVVLPDSGQPGLDSLDFDDLYNNLKVYEHELKGVSNSNSQNIAFLSAEVKGSTLKQNLLQIDEDAMEEIDIRWQVAMITARIRKFMRKTGRSIDLKPKNGITFDKDDWAKSLMQRHMHFGQDGLDDFDWSNKADDAPVSLALMATNSEIGLKVMMKSTDVSESKRKTAFNSENSETPFENSPHNNQNSVGQGNLDKGDLGTKGVPSPKEILYSISSTYKGWVDKSRVPQAVLSRSTDGSYYPRMDNRRPRISSFSPLSRSSTTRTPHRPKRPKKIVKSIWVKKGSTDGSQAVLPQTGNPEEDLKDYAIIDSGCSGSMTGDKDKLSDFKEFKGGYVAFGNDSKGGRISGKGTIKTSCLDFEKVSYVEELKFNLLSCFSKSVIRSTIVLFSDKECHAPISTVQVVDEDLWGSSKNRKKYCLVVTDDCSKFSWVFFLAYKDETYDMLPDLMGKKNMTLIEAARNMLADSLTYSIWAEAVNTRLFMSQEMIQDCRSCKTFLENQENQREKSKEYLCEDVEDLDEQQYCSNRSGPIASRGEVLLQRSFHLPLKNKHYRELGCISIKMDVKSHSIWQQQQKKCMSNSLQVLKILLIQTKSTELSKALYGLHQAPKAWYMFDDIIFGSTKSSMVKDFEDLMQKEFKMSSMGDSTSFLGFKSSKSNVLKISRKRREDFKSLQRFLTCMLSKGSFRRINFMEDVNILKKTVFLAIARNKQYCYSSTEAEYVAAASLLCSGRWQEEFDSEATVELTYSLIDEMELIAFLDASLFGTCSVRYWLRGPKRTSWEQFGTNIASALVGLATNQKFNFSLLIMNGMLGHISNGTPFLMYPRFVQLFLNKQLEGVDRPQDFIPSVSLPSKRVVNTLAAEEEHSTSPHSRTASFARDAQGTPTQSAAHSNVLLLVKRKKNTAVLSLMILADKIAVTPDWKEKVMRPEEDNIEEKEAF
ncbi:hypothetical protein Tco_0550180, partial [Tanacetum coccineum]